MRVWLLLVALVLALVPTGFGESFTPPLNLKDPAVVSKGQDFFNRRCAGRCHGRDGREGFDAPILAGKEYLTAPFVYVTLIGGRPGSAMPTWEGRLTKDEMWEVIAFVTALGDQARGEGPK